MAQFDAVGLVSVFTALFIGTSVIILKNRDAFPLGQISAIPSAERVCSLALYVFAGLVVPALPPAIVGLMLFAMGYPSTGAIFIGLSALQLLVFVGFTVYQWRLTALATT